MHTAIALLNRTDASHQQRELKAKQRVSMSSGGAGGGAGAAASVGGGDGGGPIDISSVPPQQLQIMGRQLQQVSQGGLGLLPSSPLLSSPLLSPTHSLPVAGLTGDPSIDI